jgi:hypothetical protein
MHDLSSIADTSRALAAYDREMELAWSDACGDDDEAAPLERNNVTGDRDDEKQEASAAKAR